VKFAWTSFVDQVVMSMVIVEMEKLATMAIANAAKAL
jgi:hypothetical protein